MQTYERLQIAVPEAPPIPGLSFRGFRGEADYPAMVAVIRDSREADGTEWAITVEDTARSYQHMVNCDPYQDMLFAEMDGEVIGYSRVWWDEKLDGKRLYRHFAHLLPRWRDWGIRRAMLHYNEGRLKDIAAEHPQQATKFFDVGASETETHWTSLLLSEGYEPVRYFFEMVRPNLDDVPDLPLPDGLEVRPVPPEHYRTVWEAEEEAFRDHWGAQEWRDEWFEEWLKEPTFNPDLWQVAWDGDEVAGMVLNFINEKQNAEYQRQRGWTEDICVRRPWRRQGLARALIARSLRLLKERGMTEAALGVDGDNPNGALRLYQSMGYQVTKRSRAYRKAMG